MAPTAKMVQKQLLLLKPFLNNCSLKTIRKGQDMVGELMESKYRSRVLVKEHFFGGASMALGGVVLLTEFLVNITFHEPEFIGWSLYPLLALGMLGGLLIFLAICRPAREIMERKFFI